MKKYKSLFIIFVGCVFLFIPKFSKHYFLGHDSLFHAANIMALSENIDLFDISKSNISPYIANNFGYGTGLFYPQLAHFIAALFYKSFSFFTTNFGYSMIITHFLASFIAALGIFKLSIKVFKNKNIATISAMLYLFFPYHLTDIYVRDALSESMIFSVIPFIFLGIFELFDGNIRKFYLYFIPAYSFGIYSHLVLMVYVTIFLFIFLLINIKKLLTKEKMITFISSVILVSFMASPFLITVLQHKLYGDYVVFGNNTMTDINSLKLQLFGVKDFFQNKLIGDGRQHYIDWISLCLLFSTILIINKIKLDRLQRKYFFQFICATVIIIFMMSKIFPWELMPSSLQLIQFPWRLETFLAFSISLIAPIALLKLNNSKYFFVLTIILIAIININGINNITPFSNQYVLSENIDWNAGMGAQGEYRPMKAKENEQYFGSRSNEIISLNNPDDVKINILNNSVPNMDFKVERINSDSEIIIEFPRFFYFGYILEDEYGNKYELYESENGCLTSKINHTGTYSLRYTGTFLYKLSLVLQILSIIGFVFFAIKMRRNVLL